MFVGTASWRLPRTLEADFGGEGTHLVRYARRLGAVELNSSFYRHHRRSQYAKWAREVPEGFRFAVKMPRWLTHRQRLRTTEGLDDFLDEVSGLGSRQGPLLLQLPPSLRFEPDAVASFLEVLRARFQGGVVCEPRHASWFEEEPASLLARFEVSRVAADPPPVPGADEPGADEPGAWPGRVYVRLHGNPVRFRSSYSRAFLDRLAARLHQTPRDTETWCIFNNTASEAGLRDALAMAGQPDGLDGAAPSDEAPAGDG